MKQVTFGRLLLLLPLLGLLVVYLFLRNDVQTQTIQSTGSPSAMFGEDNEYVNKQARFSIHYPLSWQMEFLEATDDTAGIKFKGREGYINIYWAQNHKKGGCTEPTTQLQLADETIDVCNFKQKNDSEIWNQIVKDTGNFTVWSDAFAASPSANTRQTILDVYHTLKFVQQ